MKRYLLYLFLFEIVSSLSEESKPTITFDEFFEFTTFPSVKFSPNGKYLLIETRRPSWNTSSYENSLWLYQISNKKKILIAKQVSPIVKPQWSPTGNWIVFLLNNTQSVSLYSIEKEKSFSIDISFPSVSGLVWSDRDTSLYFASHSKWSTKEDDDLHESKWKDVIQYPEEKLNQGTTIGRIDFYFQRRTLKAKVRIVATLTLFTGELLYVPLQSKLIFTTVAENFEDFNKYEIYSLDLNDSILSRLTTNQGIEQDLQLSIDGRSILFRLFTFDSQQGNSSDRHLRLFSVDLHTKQIQRLGKDLDGSILGYSIRSDSSLYILEQIGTNIRIHFQQSIEKYSISLCGWNGSYASVTTSFDVEQSIAFVYSSFEQPMEVYYAQNIYQLNSAKPITNENQIFTQRNLPKSKIFTWIHPEDHRTLEGILHYPPNKYEEKQLPLLVLIHGGPYEASLNQFHLSSYYWAVLAASQGWLVFEPNYRGSTGYGNQLYSEIHSQPVSRAGNDILSAVQYLIENNIADANQLAVGGYSFGGFLTNWLITQTTCFNAALTGASSIAHVSTWGLSDVPMYISDFLGGYPWETPKVYEQQSPIYFLKNVNTPTLIITGANDKRIPIDQSFMMERALRSLGVPAKLLVFPNEGHAMDNNPWHAKIKLREELKWLHKYGHNSTFRN